ncbi:hypothetical protein [Paenibacillus sp. UNC451MF]|uniref:hypothetical protein n=1 Tax=Paenibacillus sp. UNC451MF TaxID=1449063 RepID=UPI00048D7A38|nr:hypothetical protein [Paenibacillus sp. UNC451MF]
MNSAHEALERVVDAIDIETFMICGSEQEAGQLMLELLNQMGFPNGDVVFVQHEGPGARVRGRAYVHTPEEAPLQMLLKAGER